MSITLSCSISKRNTDVDVDFEFIVYSDLKKRDWDKSEESPPLSGFQP